MIPPMNSQRLLLLILLWAACLLLAAPRAGRCRTAPAAFPFVIPWDDAAAGTATDVSFLNTKPAGANGRIAVRNGRFVESGTGKRVKFLGVAFTFSSAFPSHADAEKVAARLAKYGVNLVRIHFIDQNYAGSFTLWDGRYKDFRHIDPGQRDKLDYLIAQLKKNGVYVNLNLKVARRFTPEDGLPPDVTKISFWGTKRVDEFDPQMIALQKEYARALLSHVNPYTKLPYTQDPAVFCVEINNENSLVADLWSGPGGGLADLPPPYDEELRQLWNQWLLARYATTDALGRAWSGAASGPELLGAGNDPGHWVVEQHTPASLDLWIQGAALVAEVGSADGVGWHAQMHQAGLTLEEGGTYTLRFRAKGARGLSVSVMRDQADYRTVGLAETVPLTPEWQTYQYTFKAKEVVPGHSRLTFSLGEHSGALTLADVSLRAGAAGPALAPGTLENKVVPLPGTAAQAEEDDWLLFLAHTERVYADGMRRFLKEDLGLRALVTCSQSIWGGLSGVYREAASDFSDNHGYWDPLDSLVPSLDTAGPLLSLAQSRLAGEPYSVSEYNHPFPREYQAECVPLLASVGAFQDWDVLNLHEYGDYGTGAANGNDSIGKVFAIGSNPAAWAFLPAAALLFRAGEIPPAPTSATAPIPATVDQANHGGLLSADDAWARQAGTANALLTRRLALDLGKSAATPLSAGGTTLSLTRDDPKTARFTADAPAAQVVAGFVAGQTVRLGGATFTFGPSVNDFAALTLTAMDSKPLAHSQCLLLTLLDRIQNTGQQWAADRRQLTRWGHGPTLADGILVTASVPADGPRRIYALDATGGRGQEVPTAFHDGLVTFAAGSDKTLWYEIVPQSH